MSYTAFHMRTFNVLARIFGLIALFGGVAYVAKGVYWLFVPAPKGWGFFVGPSVDAAVIGAFLALMGTLVLRVRPYRPDLGPSSGPCDWWTGDRIEG